MDKHAKLLKKIRDGNTDIRFEDLKALDRLIEEEERGGFPNEDIALYIPGGVVS